MPVALRVQGARRELARQLSAELNGAFPAAAPHDTLHRVLLVKAIVTKFFEALQQLQSTRIDAKLQMEVTPHDDGTFSVLGELHDWELFKLGQPTILEGYEAQFDVAFGDMGEVAVGVDFKYIRFAQVPCDGGLAAAQSSLEQPDTAYDCDSKMMH